MQRSIRQIALKLFGTLLLVLAAFAPAVSHAAQSEEFVSTPVTARLITVENGVPPGAGTVSAGLHLKLAEGWKTYWKSPGEVGIPPEIDWEGSTNIADVRFLWPAPTRFRAFGIENYGYKKEVVFPLQVTLKEPGQPVDFRANVSLLVCSEVCVPQNFELTLSLGSGASTDTDSAALIGTYAAQIPDDGSVTGISVSSVWHDPEMTRLVIEVRSETPFSEPDVFPDMGPDTSFGPADIRLGDGGRVMWAEVPILSTAETPPPLEVTVTDGLRAAEFTPEYADAPAEPPYESQVAGATVSELALIALVALLGGLILNVMPCVLPVLSIKFSSALKLHGQGAGRVREGFLASAAGVLAFMWLLAGILIALRAAGLSVGWGVQFQNPFFLIVMLAILLLFAANMFGLFEIALPQSWNAGLARAGARGGLVGDFLTGAFAAVLATPCSAPFLGTAVTFALAGRPLDIVVIFTAMGIGLALPYLLVAARPGWVTKLPRPGRWMVVVKWALGALLALTAVWLIWVLAGVAGQQVAIAATIFIAVAILLIRFPARAPALLRTGGFAALGAAALAVPVLIEPAARADVGEEQVIPWVAFDRAQIARLVSQGEVVFVDVTADWCLTCKANKALVIDRSPVADILISGRVLPMQADWTRPDENIRRFLEDNGRYGIPFDIVYGPAAPEGIALPEVLTTQAVLDAMEKAGAAMDLAEN